MMKALLSKIVCFSALFVHVYFSSEGQSYVPIAQKGNEWTTITISSLGFSFRYYQYDKDTLVNNVLYDKIKGSSTYLVREEGGKVYLSWTGGAYLGEEYTKEFLRYDFALQEKDTFYTAYAGPEYLMFPTKMVVSVVDSVVLENGTKHKRIMLDVPNERDKMVWIEGVGSTFGLDYFHHYSTSLRVQLACFGNNGEVLWKSLSPMLNCIDGFPVGLEEESTPSLQNLVQVFPNPTKSTSTLLNNGNERLQFYLFNSSGQKVSSDDILEKGGKKILNLSELPRGIYFLQLVGESGKRISKSIQVL